MVFSSEDAVEWASKGEKVILVREETSPEDVDGMHKSEAILTTKGGMTSHALHLLPEVGVNVVS